jgi:16S rRNA C967 or C1407 C5-methylase (RsmB/RsmF family)
MTTLPVEFTTYTRQLMGDERFERYLRSFEEEAPVSIRLNPKKPAGQPVDGEEVPWCRHAYYLKSRPNFTFDPLFHAGCYYVQEAASMFLDEVIRQLLTVNGQWSALDLCAAPGGKSTLLRSALPEESVLYSNEPIRNRANILLENVQKWGFPNHIVTNNYPKDYRRSKLHFDLILCDVPCSGEGMFRKDEATIREWSPQNVEKCWKLQREIVADAWECLNEGGLFIYSTCTFNTKENEENIRWILENYEAKVLKVEIKPEWNITGSLLDGFNEPVYRFIPGISRGEGLFMCVLRKASQNSSHSMEQVLPKPGTTRSKHWNTSFQGLEQLVPSIGTNEKNASFPLVELSYPQAMAYLRHEALVLPEETPRGLVEVCFLGHPLGLAKNIGNRANNLYPKEWKIKTTHLPNEYEPILKQI